MSVRPQYSWEYFRMHRIRGCGQSQDTILPASALDHKKQNERICCFPLGPELLLQLIFTLFLKILLSQPCSWLIPSLKYFHWQRAPLCYFPYKNNHDFFWTWILVGFSVTFVQEERAQSRCWFCQIQSNILKCFPTFGIWQDSQGHLALVPLFSLNAEPKQKM